MAVALQFLLTCCLMFALVADRPPSLTEATHAVGDSLAVASATTKAKSYTTNAICRQYNCINPIVPGLSDLAQLSATTWQCQQSHEANKFMNFCKNAVYYNPAVPNPKNKTSMEHVITAQDNAASTAYFYALSGMNLEPWSHRQPWLEQDSCLTSIYKAVCGTYFPRAEAGCKAGQHSNYLRPCKNVCENYLKACNVECCDESVQCVFKKEVSLLNGKSTVRQGYADHDGPSAMCTGAAAPNALRAQGLFQLLLVALFLATE